MASWNWPSGPRSGPAGSRVSIISYSRSPLRQSAPSLVSDTPEAGLALSDLTSVGQTDRRAKADVAVGAAPTEVALARRYVWSQTHAQTDNSQTTHTNTGRHLLGIPLVSWEALCCCEISLSPSYINRNAHWHRSFNFTFSQICYRQFWPEFSHIGTYFVYDLWKFDIWKMKTLSIFSVILCEPSAAPTSSFIFAWTHFSRVLSTQTCTVECHSMYINPHRGDCATNCS